MLFTAVLGLLTTAALATAIPTELAPRAVSIQQMHQDLHNTEGCNLLPGQNCAGSSMHDVIVVFDGTDKTKEISMYVAATNAAGGSIVHEYPGHGFSGFVPEQVLTLIAAQGKPMGVKIQDNACMTIPWCGEAPC
ncbi:hypothetical protein K504DRAFT_128970 [Pleomassaria siparia CBS 279.74]|uniref:Uncharacterized protein n=1 Tax=Pleomassaria siparia CBS 279.74 TaxID=1314801 RepID=A0A6G1KJR2_9PLEO|nr:hypothetical protein K504DRAFT_128970 [Pleomassaria siparia CBS 279.74]